MVVHVVDVDQLAGVDDVAHDARGEGESHLILLEIQSEMLQLNIPRPPYYNRERLRGEIENFYL